MDSAENMELSYSESLACSSAILKKAKELGASIAGICDLSHLKKAPSFTLAPKLPQADVGSRESSLGLKPGEVFWPEDAKSAIVIAYEHPKDQLELDWWFGKHDPPGNKILVDINKKLSAWIEKNYPIKTYPCPYHVEKGGVFLKDAAYYAGLGCIGKNNLFITPEYGPRVRLRAMLFSVKLPSTGPSAFNPCEECDSPCLQNCPGNAFNEVIYSAETMGQEMLPGRSGTYSREKCNNQMKTDSSNAKEQIAPEVSSEPVKIIKYCRNCEFSCPVGK